eukprot:7800059-Pyramimonas_sp.AAC.1
MAHPFLLGLSLLRYSRAGVWLRLVRCWLGLPAPFKLICVRFACVGSATYDHGRWVAAAQLLGQSACRIEATLIWCPAPVRHEADFKLLWQAIEA